MLSLETYDLIVQAKIFLKIVLYMKSWFDSSDHRDDVLVETVFLLKAFL